MHKDIADPIDDQTLNDALAKMLDPTHGMTPEDAAKWEKENSIAIARDLAQAIQRHNQEMRLAGEEIARLKAFATEQQQQARRAAASLVVTLDALAALHEACRVMDAPPLATTAMYNYLTALANAREVLAAAGRLRV